MKFTIKCKNPPTGNGQWFASVYDAVPGAWVGGAWTPIDQDITLEAGDPKALYLGTGFTQELTSGVIPFIPQDGKVYYFNWATMQVEMVPPTLADIINSVMPVVSLVMVLAMVGSVVTQFPKMLSRMR